MVAQKRDPEVAMSLFSSSVNRLASLETHVESLHTSTSFKLSPKIFKLSQIISLAARRTSVGFGYPPLHHVTSWRINTNELNQRIPWKSKVKCLICVLLAAVM